MTRDGQKSRRHVAWLTRLLAERAHQNGRKVA